MAPVFSDRVIVAVRCWVSFQVLSSIKSNQQLQRNWKCFKQPGARAAILADWSAGKHVFGRRRWGLSFSVLSKAFEWLQRRKLLQPIGSRGGHLGWRISTRDTKLVEDLEDLLHLQVLSKSIRQSQRRNRTRVPQTGYNSPVKSDSKRFKINYLYFTKKTTHAYAADKMKWYTKFQLNMISNSLKKSCSVWTCELGLMCLQYNCIQNFSCKCQSMQEKGVEYCVS